MAEFTPDLQARSPWAALSDVAVVELAPAEGPIIGEIVVPGSKSFTNRALIMAAFAQGTSRVAGILKSDDSFWCLETLRKLGVKIEVDDDVVVIEGVDADWPVQGETLYVGAAGTTARFLPGLLAASNQGGRWIIEGSKRMNERPMRPLLQSLKDLGADLCYLQNEGHLPVAIVGTGLRGGVVEISGSTSSQFVSGLLIATPYAEKAVTVRVVDHIVQHAYVLITLDLMKQFGVDVQYTDDLKEMTIEPQRYQGREITLEADASTSGYFLALAAVTNGKVRINNLSYNTHQPDVQLVDVLERMGCQVTRGDGFIELVGTEQLRGGFEISFKEMSDMTLTLAAIAPFADGPIAIHDVAHIRKHESDRISVICDALSKMGIKVEEREDGLTVYPGTPKPVELDSHDDHRVAMSLSLIAARIPGVRITDPGCVSKTCPTFFDELRRFGMQVSFEK